MAGEFAAAFIDRIKYPAALNTLIQTYPYLEHLEVRLDGLYSSTFVQGLVNLNVEKAILQFIKAKLPLLNTLQLVASASSSSPEDNVQFRGVKTFKLIVLEALPSNQTIPISFRRLDKLVVQSVFFDEPIEAKLGIDSSLVALH